MSPSSTGYLALLRHNKPFRWLWYGQVTSQLGDWLDSIALYTLLLRMTGSGAAVGWLLVAQFLPSTLVGLGAGVLVDRLSRKHVMIATDLGCAFLVLLFLFVQNENQIWIIYVVTILKVALTSLFEPAREAVIPNVTKPEELIAANGISSITWSSMLAGGAALGGLVTGLFGTEAAFILDSLSFLLSAAFTACVPIHEAHLDGAPRAGLFQEFREGFHYLLRQREVLVYALCKALWSLGGGVLLLLTLFGKEIFPLGKDGALSIGLMYAARGVGAGIGPPLAQFLGGTSTRFLRRLIGPGFLLTALGYAAFSRVPGWTFSSTTILCLAVAALIVAHIGGSIQWVHSTALLQLNVPNRLQGRIFAIELALLTLAISVSSYTVGAASDAGWPPQTLALAVAGVFVLPGILLTVFLWRDPPQAELGEKGAVSAQPALDRRWRLSVQRLSTSTGLSRSALTMKDPAAQGDPPSAPKS